MSRFADMEDTIGELPSSAEVVVIGGGVMGASTLYHLAKAGCHDAVLVERETLAAGSTSRAAGGFRAQFSDELNIRLALESIRRLERFVDEPGADIDFKQWGYLFLLQPEEVATFEASIALQNSLGVPSRLLTASAAADLIPGLRTDDLGAATFCPIDGYCTPEAVVHGYAAGARRLGATIVQGCEVRAITAVEGQVTGVETSAGRVDTPVVACCAGVWTRDLVAAVGLELPVEPEARHVFVSAPGDPLPRELPLTIDFATGFYFHREGEGLLLGGRETSLEDLAPIAVHRLPLFAELGVRPGWWGYYAMSPDHNAVVGAAESPAGLLYATGFSGHGFQQGPVVGEYLADLALGRPPAFDLSPFDVSRFSSGRLKPESNVV